MADSLPIISLLYELSVTTLRNLSPEETAEGFLKKILSRKNLSAGIIWLTEIDGEKTRLRKLYGIPVLDTKELPMRENLDNLFREDSFLFTERSITGALDKPGYYAYYRLGKVGLLELYEQERQESLRKESFYPFRDVFNQLAISLESGISYQNLQKEIEHRKQVEKSLMHNREKYRRIVDNIHLGLLEVNTEERIQYANQPFCDFVGYTLAEMVGKNASELFLDDKGRAEMSVRNQERADGKSGAYKIAVKTKSGETRWGIISGAPNYDLEGNQIGSIGIHLDITHQVDLANKNAFQESLLNNLFEVSLDALISIDNRGMIIEWNPQAEKIFGYTREEVLNKTLSETIIPHAFREAHSNGMKNYHHTGKSAVLNQRIEITALRKSGEEFPIELTIFPIRQGETHFFTAFVRDITELKSSREAMNNALKKQTELNKMQSQFVSMTSHELRTPLTTISADVEIMNYFLDNTGTIDPEKLRKIISRVDTNVERLNNLINNILTVGKLDAQKVSFSPVPIQVHELMYNKILPQYDHKENPVIYKASGLARDVMLDKKLFSHIIDNLLSNAYKYAGEQSPELGVKFTEDELIITVKDQGIGIPEEDLKKLFGSFFRASNVGSIQGTGLGLNIVREFVTLHGGEIRAESEVGKGTTFILKFPINTDN